MPLFFSAPFTGTHVSRIISDSFTVSRVWAMKITFLVDLATCCCMSVLKYWAKSPQAFMVLAEFSTNSDSYISSRYVSESTTMVWMAGWRADEHTYEIQSLLDTSSVDFCL